MEQLGYKSLVTEDGRLVLIAGDGERVLCALPAVFGRKFPIAAVPRSNRKARAMMVPRGVPWDVSPLRLVVVLHQDDGASRELLACESAEVSDAILAAAHPGLVAEYLAKQGRWDEVESLLLHVPGAIDWVQAAAEAQVMAMTAEAIALAATLQTLRDFAAVVPVRAAAKAALEEIRAEVL
jgi:hypothetical protein